ncbi:hypothetical protein B0H14DRAFT_2640338 [Mycena olivaceomarginata]|nr:hypothetical protein B0H14DRAFT_2640338 [Mycena olivaceomarginata]
MDANFRLSNCNKSTEIADPTLGDGFGYFCRHEGEDRYKAHILKHADKEEILNCSGFAAMFIANTKRVKGLRTTGIGGGDVLPTQHVAGKWDKISASGQEVLKRLWLKLKLSMVLWKVPNFHFSVHKLNCHSPFSFHFMWGAGMTHREGVEQNWVFSNGAAASMRLMGPGAHQATLEDVFGFHNYNCVLAMFSIKEGMKHKVAFEVFTESLEEAWPEDVAEWKAHVFRWEAMPHPKTSESPFKLVDEVSTLWDIQLRIAVEEFVCMKDGVEIECDHTPGSCITMGLELEQVQWKLEIDVQALKDPLLVQKLVFIKCHTLLFKRIHRFCQIQGVYMPALCLLLSDDQKQVYDRNSEQQPEATWLFMPSELASNDLQAMACAMGLAAIEARMREGEVDELLEANWTGQGMMTKDQDILHHINIKIHTTKLCY